MQIIKIKPFFFFLLPVFVFLSAFAHAGDISGRVEISNANENEWANPTI
jgi:hypothetical protein